MKPIVVAEAIGAPPADVFALMTGFEKGAETIRAITKVEMLTPGPVGNGTRFRETRVMFGKEASEVMEVREFEPPRRFVLAAESHGCRYRTELLFEPAGSGTRVSMLFSAVPLTLGAKIVWFLTKPFMSGLLARTCAQDLRDVKEVLEARAAA